MYQAIYREYRPEVLEDVIGQDHIVRILKNQIANDEVGHAYLLCGTRGTGKTTIARLIAKAVNCLGEGDRPCGECANCRSISDGTFIDVIEVDAATNTGVDNIRDLRETINYPPVAGRKKVYIIDEAHMLSQAACNALLKTLEEPPEYCVFILATTEPNKLLPTILSRCIRLDFKRVPDAKITMRLKEITEDKGIRADDDALALIASNGDGSVRDSLSILEQCLAGAGDHLTRDDVLLLLGLPSVESIITLTTYVSSGDISSALAEINNQIDRGRDVRQMMNEWLSHFRNLLIAKYVESPENMLNMSSENAAKIKEQAELLDVSYISFAVRELGKAINEAKASAQSRILLELCAVTLASGNTELNETPKVTKKKAAVKTGDLWQETVARAKTENAAFAILEKSTEMISSAGGVLKIKCANKTAHSQIADNIEILESAASEIAGEKICISCESEIEAKAESIGSKLSIDIEIE